MSLLYTPNIGYRLSDWKREPIVKVFAGTDCIMALTADGRMLQKTVRPDLAVRTEYWTRIRQAALSKWMPCAAIGLVEDGTCLISKRALRSLCEQGRGVPFDRVNNTVKSWKRIRQVAVSDAYFALDEDGRVHFASPSLFGNSDYRGTAEWTNIRRIVTGSQNSVFGITEDGRILCEGSNLRRGPHGDLQQKLLDIRGAADLCATGSECEEVFILLKDGTVLDYRGQVQPARPRMDGSAGEAVLEGHFFYTACMTDSDGQLIYLPDGRKVFPESPGRVVSFAIGDIDYRQPFVLAVVSPE